MDGDTFVPFLRSPREGDLKEGGGQQQQEHSPNFVAEFPSVSTSTVDPWLPVSSSSTGEGVSSTSPKATQEVRGEEEVESSDNVTQWLEGVQPGDSGFAQDQEEDMSPPATGGTTGGSGDHGATSKCPCPHVAKAQSMPGLRKALKGDIRIACSKDTCEAINAKQWMCLQCGHVGCGDDVGAGGHAKLHLKTPRSDSHCIAVQMQGNFETAWCYDCRAEINVSTSHQLKDCLNFIKRSSKIKSALSGSAAASPPIALGPPPPPPVPKVEPPKQFTSKAKQNNRMNASSSGSNRWDRDRDTRGVDWPMGLDNLGNTCFMNSALQCLSRTRPRSLLDKLDLYGSGNLIEILVSPEEPCVQIMNPNVESNEHDDAEFSSDNDRALLINSGSQPSTSADSSEGGSGEISPSTTEIDSLLDAASSRSSRKSESDTSSGDSEKQIWKKELEQELAKPLRLRLVIPKDSMTSKLRHCFKAITRSSDVSPDSEKSTSYSRSVYSPRGIQTAVSKHFRLGHQHDSHELLRTVVDMMKKDQIKSFRLAIMQRYGVKRNEGKNCDPKLTELLKMWDRKLYHKTFVDEIFGGELVTFQECLQCRNVRRSHEEFLDLSLPIRVFRVNPNPNPRKTYSLFDDDNDYVINRSVEECLRAYTEPEFLTGSNAVECEKCHRVNLDKLEHGATFEEVFPDVNLNAQSNSSGNSGKTSKHQMKKQQTKARRQSRQSKLKAKHQVDFTNQSTSSENPSGLNFVDGHFTNDTYKSPEKGGGHEDDSKSSKSGSLDDYVVVQNSSTLNNNNQPQRLHQKNTHHDVEMDYDAPDASQQDDDTCKLGEESNLSRGLSSSIKSLTLIENGMDVEEEGCLQPEDDDQQMDHHNDQNLDEYMDDLDEPAVDGIGNASDIEDDESNGPAPLDLGLEVKPISVADYLAVPTISGGIADEGFSEGENSSEDKPSQSLSGASSHNSISEVDNIADTCDNKPPKKIPITKCPCSRRQLISRAPECLTLHLKRFQHTARGSSKLSDKVSFPYLLNLTEFCSEVDEDVNKPGFKSTFDEDGEVFYSLYGIVEHSGSLHFGHYVAYVKVAGKPTTTESPNVNPADDHWFYISDSHVSQTTLKQTLAQDAYILFYERIRGPEKKERLGRELRAIEVERDSWTKRPTVTYSYEKPVASTSSWEDNQQKSTNKWEDSSSNHQVSSTNEGSGNEDMSITLNYEPDPVSSSTIYSCAPLLDGVSSTTDADIMDFSATVLTTNSASSSHPLWNDDDIRRGSAFFGDIMADLEDDGEQEDEDTLNRIIMNNNNPVSSSSDVINSRPDGYTRLEEID